MLLKDLLKVMSDYCFVRIFYICEDEPEFEGEHYDVPWCLAEKKIREDDGICPFIDEEGIPSLRISLEVK